MKRLLTSLSLLFCLAAAGQDAVSAFSSSLEGKCADFAYSYSISGRVPLSGSGKVSLQGDSFTMKGDDLEVYCDGTSRWTLDTTAEECYIEGVEGELDFEANPALLVGAVDKAFDVRKTDRSTFNGQSVTRAVLAPKSDGGNIKEVSLFITAAGKPAGVVVTISDGTLITVTVKDFVLSAEKPSSSFAFNTDTLSKSYVITDLR